MSLKGQELITAVEEAKSWNPTVAGVTVDESGHGKIPKGCKMEFLATDLISVPPDHNKYRAFNEKFAKTALAGSIKSEGQGQPIRVRALTGGTYELIDGRHRLVACQHLGIPVMAIIMDTPDLIADLSRISSTVFRNNLKEGAATDKAIAEYVRLYEALHPDAKGSVVRAKKGAHAAAVAKATKAGKPAPAAPEIVKPARAVVAEATGLTPEQVNRSAKRGNVLSEEQASLLELKKIPQKVVDKIVGITDPNTRNVAVTKIAAGADAVSVLNAIATASVEGVEAQLTEEEMTDDQYLAQCPIYESGKCVKLAFAREALFYRKFQASLGGEKAINVWKKGVKAFTKENGGKVFNKGFSGQLSRFVSMSHPTNWKTCAACSGKGNSCEKCESHGFLTK